MFVVMFFGQHPADLDDLGSRKPQSGVVLGEQGQHIPGQRVLEGIGFDEDERLFEFFWLHARFLSSTGVNVDSATKLPDQYNTREDREPKEALFPKRQFYDKIAR